MKVSDVPVADPRGRLAGKVAVIVGGGSPTEGWSNGSAVAALFAREGAAVHVVDLSAAAAGRTREVIRVGGGTCSVSVADATSLDSMQGAIDECVKTHGRIDILHNNAGGGRRGSLLQTTEKDWREVLDRNLTAPFFASKCVIPVMVKQKSGVLVHISSAAGAAYFQGNSTAYSVAKAGVLQLSRNIAMQHVTDGIRSNCIILGSVRTAELTRRFVENVGQGRVEEGFQRMGSKVPMGRVASVWELAHTVLYLASEESSFVTGTEVVMDGGATVPVLPAFN